MEDSAIFSFIFSFKKQEDFREVEDDGGGGGGARFCGGLGRRASRRDATWRAADAAITAVASWDR